MQSMLRQQGELDETYLVGVSMGGHVTAAAIETYRNLWDGALSACGVVGDVELFDYFLDYNVGAAAFAGLAPDYRYPDPNWMTTTVPGIKAALSTNPTGQWAGGLPQILGAPSPLTPAGQAFKDFVEVGSGGNRVTYDVAWNYWHGLASSTGDFFFDLAEGDGTIANRTGTVAQNTDMTYLEEYGFDIDAQVKRVDASNRVRNSPGRAAGTDHQRHAVGPDAHHPHHWRPVRPDRDGAALRPRGDRQRSRRFARATRPSAMSAIARSPPTSSSRRTGTCSPGSTAG